MPHTSDEEYSQLLEGDSRDDEYRSLIEKPEGDTGLDWERIIQASPIGQIASQVEFGEKIMGKGLGAVGKAYDWAVGQPTAATAGIARFPKTALAKVAEVEQIPETLIKKGLLHLEGKPNKSSTWANVFYNAPGAGLLPKEARKSLAKTAGVIAEPVLDPMFFARPLGATAKGMEAAKAGMMAENIGQAGRAGERALLAADIPGVGRKTVIQGKPILDLMGNIQSGLRKNFPGFHTKTSSTPFNMMREEKLISPDNYATMISNERIAVEDAIVLKHAKELGIDPAELRTKMTEAIEPKGSQAKGPFIPETQEAFPKPVQELVDKYKGERQKFHKTESAIKDFGNRDFYQKHVRTPEANEFLKSVWGDKEVPQFVSKVSGKNVSAKKRDMSADYTINEINNIFREGKANEKLYGGKFPEANNFKKNYFSDDAVRVAAERYLQNAKVLNAHDFKTHTERTFGMPPDAFHKGRANGELKADEWTESLASNGKDKIFYPKEIGDFLNHSEQLAKNPMVSKGIKKVWGHVMDYIRIAGYGGLPKSVIDNILGGPVLLLMNDIFDPVSHIQAASLATKMARGKVGNGIVLEHPTLGKLTEQHVLDIAKKERGVGLGLARFELSNVEAGKNLVNTKWVKGMMDAQDFAENINRLSGVINTLKKGYTPAGAGKATRNAMYDYSDLSAADRSIRRGIPFFTFTRKNLPAMMGLSVKNPALFSAPEKFREAMGGDESKKNERMMYESKRDQMPLYLGMKDGEPWYSYMGRYLPMSDMNRFIASGEDVGEMARKTPAKAIESAVGMFSPVGKAPVEAALNYSMFRHGPIQRMPGERTLFMRGMPPLPPKLTYALQNVPLLNQLGALSNPNHPKSLTAFRGAFGPEIKEFNTEEAGLAYKRGQKKILYDAKNLPKLYASQAAIRRQRGDVEGALESERNMREAIRNARKEVVKVRERMQQ